MELNPIGASTPSKFSSDSNLPVIICSGLHPGSLSQVELILTPLIQGPLRVLRSYSSTPLVFNTSDAQVEPIKYSLPFRKVLSMLP